MEAPEDAGDAEGIVFAIDPVSDAAEAAVAAARRLVTALLDADRVPGDEMAAIASELGAIADRIESRVPARDRPAGSGSSGAGAVGAGERTWATRPREEAALRNPVNGRQNTIAPGLRMRGMPDGSVAGDVTLGLPYEGPPGFVHGGISAMLLDHLFGAANFWAGAVGPTAELTLRYRRPTPLFTPLRLRARQESADGRKLRTTGAIEADGKVCVEAEGLFIVKHNFGVRE